MEILYDVLFQPVAAMRQIAARRLVGQALAAFLISVLIPAGAAYFALKAAGAEAFAGVIILIHTLGRLVTWIVGAAVLQLIAELAGGQGSAAGLFAALGFAHLPWIFIVPVSVVAMLLPAGPAAMVFGGGAVVIFFWSIALWTAALRGANALGTAKALLVLLAPLLALGAAAVAVAAFVGAAFWPRLG